MRQNKKKLKKKQIQINPPFRILYYCNSFKSKNNLNSRTSIILTDEKTKKTKILNLKVKYLSRGNAYFSSNEYTAFIHKERSILDNIDNEHNIPKIPFSRSYIIFNADHLYVFYRKINILFYRRLLVLTQHKQRKERKKIFGIVPIFFEKGRRGALQR